MKREPAPALHPPGSTAPPLPHMTGLAQAGMTRASRAITAVASCLPVLVLTRRPTCSAPTPRPRMHRTAGSGHEPPCDPVLVPRGSGRTRPQAVRGSPGRPARRDQDVLAPGPQPGGITGSGLGPRSLSAAQLPHRPGAGRLGRSVHPVPRILSHASTSGATAVRVSGVRGPRSRPTARPAVASTGITPLLAGPPPRDACRVQMVRYHRTGSRAGRVTPTDELTEIEAAAQDGGQDPWAPGW